jgi:uncharacterized protein (TIGR00251 family)
LRLLVIVTPRARRNEIAGRHGDGWKVRVAAPPERGRANAALISLLAEALRIPSDGIRVIAGGTGRRKIVEVEGIGEEEAQRRLEAAGRA